jgi:hypothetical protein
MNRSPVLSMFETPASLSGQMTQARACHMSSSRQSLNKSSCTGWADYNQTNINLEGRGLAGEAYIHACVCKNASVPSPDCIVDHT